MRALIFNSGLGRRLGSLTVGRPKCMVELAGGEAIFHRQLRILSACGVRDFVVTTGPYPEQLRRVAAEFEGKGCTFEFVRNARFAETNYIYSFWLARECLQGGSFLMLHGDLVFDAAYAQSVVDSPLESLGSVNASAPPPEKDFGAQLDGGEVRKVAVGLSGPGCVAFQPFYKLSERAMSTWLESAGRYVASGSVGAYAEDAANEVFGGMGVGAFSYEGHFVGEVDTPEDLVRASAAVRELDREQQPVLWLGGDGSIEVAHGHLPGNARGGRGVPGVLGGLGARRPLVVSGRRFRSLRIAEELDSAGVPYAVFSGYGPNPTVGEAMGALRAYREAGCDSLLSVGGGSAIDVAKCAKQLLAMPAGEKGANLGSGGLPWSGVPHVAVPTTAGTGSESTRFAVCYVGGEKVSVANDCLLPDVALLEPSSLASLPAYQKKCTLLDALCQAVESHWSRRSCERSREWSAEAIALIATSADAYLAGDADAARAAMLAANLAGRAIDITTTTAPHAMSYKLASLYGMPHGHAVALCMPGCWRVLIERGDGRARERLEEIASILTGSAGASAEDGLAAFGRLVARLDLPRVLPAASVSDAQRLAATANAQRISNFPVELTAGELAAMYREIIGCGQWG